jgi:hypothetical protein
MPATQCACGFIANEADDQTIADHLLEVFAPEDDKGTDGRVHLEGERSLTCLCGLVAASSEELDAHFVAVFTPADEMGRDGKKHHPVTANND